MHLILSSEADNDDYICLVKLKLSNPLLVAHDQPSATLAYEAQPASQKSSLQSFANQCMVISIPFFSFLGIWEGGYLRSR